jgi:uncharacterized protein
LQQTPRRGFLFTALAGLGLPEMATTSAPGRQLVGSCLWRRSDGTGLERFELFREEASWILRGTILAMDDHGPAEACYEIVCDAEWRTEHADISLRDSTGERNLKLRAGRGRWEVDGREEEALRGCIDLDLGWSPSTNTLPIRRLKLPVGRSSGPLQMAWVRFPELQLEPLPQEYLRKTDRIYRYTSRGEAFAADLEVDDEGLVVEYQGVWQRVDERGGATTQAELFMEALRAPGPSAGQADRMSLYDPLLGSWAVDVIDHDPGGAPRTSTGEWHFHWVLEGRAIQDVWISPPRASRRPGLPTEGNRYGTTLRVYDPVADVWHVTWTNPVSGTRNTLVGRKQGDEIVQEGTDADGSLIRWIFSGLTRESFRWRGEASSDGGKTWRLAAEFRGRRLSAGHLPYASSSGCRHSRRGNI